MFIKLYKNMGLKSSSCESLSIYVDWILLQDNNVLCYVADQN